jgi:hypothetical protein
MVAITTFNGLRVHTGGSAALAMSAPATGKDVPPSPATIVTVSDRARQLLAEAKAAQMVGDIFALANGVTACRDAAKPEVMIAHDVQTNAGLYIVWSQGR